MYEDSFTHPDIVCDLEPLVGPDVPLKDLGQPAVLTDVLLEAADPVIADNEPKFQRAEPAGQRDSPVLENQINKRCSDSIGKELNFANLTFYSFVAYLKTPFSRL